MVYLGVAELEVTLERVVEAGGSVLTQRRRIGADDGYFALVADPEGTVVGIWSAS